MHSLKRFSFLLVIFSLAFFTYTCTDSTGSTGPVPGDENGGRTENSINSKAAPGSSAEFYLRGDEYTALQVEIDYMPGHKPTRAGLDSLKTFLQDRLNKQSVSFELTEVPSGGKDAYTISEIRSLEEKYRDNFTQKNDETLHSYFLMVDGEYENPNVIGVAYWNTSLAVFGKTIEDISSGLAAPPEEKIEGTVFRHEFGHLMGLVGNGTPTQSNHKTSGGAHCTTDGCLMNPAVETANFFANIF
ncbi:MAG TPA: hypothetical protein VFG39_01235, partial [Balneolaceae bacterium]|nr:hypothetical protein [Balneolaceae bacterium]